MTDMEQIIATLKDTERVLLAAVVEIETLRAAEHQARAALKVENIGHIGIWVDALRALDEVLGETP